MEDAYISDATVPIWEYLDVTPIVDYWYADAKNGMWVVYRSDGKTYQKPIRPADWIKEPSLI